MRVIYLVLGFIIGFYTYAVIFFNVNIEERLFDVAQTSYLTGCVISSKNNSPPKEWCELSSKEFENYLRSRITNK